MKIEATIENAEKLVLAIGVENAVKLVRYCRQDTERRLGHGPANTCEKMGFAFR